MRNRLTFFTRPDPLLAPEWLLAIQALAFWPIWRWYAHRLLDRSGEAWGIVALATAVLFVVRRRSEAVSSIPALWLPSAMMIAYALSYRFLSPLPRAAIAVTALAATVSAFHFGQKLRFSLWGLSLLALPVVASFQYYLGFPMRAVVTKLTEALLRLNGLAVTAEGACLNWNGKSILVDAPCSGVKMLWTGFYLTFALACYYRLNSRRTILACVGTLFAILIGNTIRAAALFYVEAGALNLETPSWTHEGVGAGVFAITAIAITWMAQRIATTEIRFAFPFSRNRMLKRV